MIRKELTGMLPAAIEKFEELLTVAEELSPHVTKGYDSSMEQDSFFAWGCACQIAASDMTALQAFAKALGITWLDDDGSMAYTGGQTINDFKTFRVNGNLELMPPEEV
jgi:hypothetical protein